MEIEAKTKEIKQLQANVEENTAIIEKEEQNREAKNQCEEAHNLELEKELTDSRQKL